MTTDYYLSPLDVQRISDTVEKVLGVPLDYSSRVALENALIADTAQFTENVQDVIGGSVVGTGGASTSYDDSSGLTTVTLDADLTALATLATLGLIVRTASGALATRSITAPVAGIAISAGDGVAGNPTLSLVNDLAAIEGLAATGFAVRTGADTWAQRSLVQPGAGLTISQNDGVTGNPTFALANDLAALEGLGSTGIAVRTAADTWAQRSIAGTAGRIAVTNGDGVSGNPTVDMVNVGTAGTYSRVTTDASGRVTSGTNEESVTGFSASQTTKVADYTATASDFTVFGNGTFNVFLPAAASNAGRIYAVRNIGVGTVTIDPNAAELIDGAATKALAAGAFALIQCDGTQWFTIG